MRCLILVTLCQSVLWEFHGSLLLFKKQTYYMHYQAMVVEQRCMWHGFNLSKLLFFFLLNLLLLPFSARPFRVPAILVGDGRLGGISGTISAYESLTLRGYDVVAVVFEDHGLLNEGPLLSYMRNK